MFFTPVDLSVMEPEWSVMARGCVSNDAVADERLVFPQGAEATNHYTQFTLQKQSSIERTIILKKSP